MAKVSYSRERLDRNDVALNLLAYAAGATDVIGFVVLGDIFTSAMTGNTALLGIAIGEKQLIAAARSFDALIAFLLGVALGTIVQRRGQHRHELATVLGVEALCLVAFLVNWVISPSGVSGNTYFLIFSLAMAMGVQSVAARIFNLPGIPTIVFTSTLTSIVMAVTSAAINRTPLPLEGVRQIVVFLAYFVGALVAAFLVGGSHGYVAIMPLIAVLCALIMQFKPQPED